MNQIILRKIERIKKIRNTINSAKSQDKKIDKKKLISCLIVEDAISYKTAKEEVEAVLHYVK